MIFNVVMMLDSLLIFIELLIFDEPTVGVDRESKKVFFDLINHLNKHHNITIILVTHEAELSELGNIRNLELRDGEIKEYV